MYPSACAVASLGEAKINLATIGVLSWISLAYAFKFLWSPAVDRLALPELPVEDFIGCVDALVRVDRRWVPEPDASRMLGTTSPTVLVRSPLRMRAA